MIRYRYENQVAALILRKECVVIPKIGGFLVYALPARISEEDQRIIPPGKKLVFHAGLRDMNHVLAQTVADYYGLPLASAKELVDKESLKLKDELEAGRSILLKGIGAIKSEESGLIFEACPTPESLICPEMGLKTTALPPAILKLPVKEEPIKVSPATASRKNRNWLRIAASLALPIAIGAGFLFQQPSQAFLSELGGFSSAKKEYKTRGYFPTQVNTATELSTLEETSFNGEGIAILELNEKKIPIKLATSDVKTHQFEIIGGCFKDLDNANTAVTRFTKRGYAAFISSYKNNLYYVSIGKYTSRTQVKNALGKARTDLGLDLWYVSI